MILGRKCLLTLFALVVLIELETLKGSTASYKLMRELGFIVWVVVASALSVDLVMSVFRFTFLPASQYSFMPLWWGKTYPNRKP